VITERRYKRYKQFLKTRKLIRGQEKTVKIRGEELEMTGYQGHVPSIYNKFPKFREHFNKYKEFFMLVGEITETKGIFNRFHKELGLDIIDKEQARKWREALKETFYGCVQSRSYYPVL